MLTLRRTDWPWQTGSNSHSCPSRDLTLSVYGHWLIEPQQQVEVAGCHIADSGRHFWCDYPLGRLSFTVLVYDGISQ